MRPIPTLLLLLLTATAHGQSAIQKCVGPDGKIVYQDTPCLQQQKAVATIKRDTTPVDRDARIRAEREKTQAKLMEIERERQWLDEEIRQAKAELAERRARERAESEARADARTRAVVDALQQPYAPIILPSLPSYSPPPERPAPPAPKPAPPTYTGPAAFAPKK